MDSIIQQDKTHCFICEMSECGDHLDKHHVFGGAYRDKSEQYGLTVYIHHNKCHIFGENSAHMNRAVQAKLQWIAQKKAMEVYGWTAKEFIKIFGRNCIGGQDD